ncbi:MAG: hypothetical protein SOR57_07035 [Parabacteroides sp.]|nr:hypothetical protein [Parabacteroides sp.]
MKNFFKGAVLCLAMSVCCVSFTSCSDDNEEEQIQVDKNPLEEVDINYSIDLDDDWYKFFDIEVRYAIGGDEETITITEDWKLEKTISYSEDLKTYICYVTARPKAELPAIEEGVTYHLGYKITANVAGILKDGSIGFDGDGNKSRTLALPAEGMKKQVTGEHKLLTFSYTYTPEKK